MLHRLTFLYSNFIVVQFLVFSIGATLIGEILARRTAPLPSRPTQLGALAHVHGYVRHFALPNYWMVYDYEALREAITVQKDNLGAFLVHTLFNAVIGTNVIGLFVIFASMNLASRSFEPNHFIFRVSWVPGLAAFVLDLVEDLCVVLACFAFPDDFRAVGNTAAVASFAKFCCWGLIAVGWCILLVKMVVDPPTKLRGD